MILSGRIAPGTKLPAERALSLKFQVNRGAVREALSRLSENRLVSVKQGSGAVVNDWTGNFRLDFLADLLFVNGRLNFPVFRSVLELRELIGPEMAGLACRRAAPKELAELERLAKELSRNSGRPERFQQLEYRFNQTLARASGNLAFEFMVNSIGSIYLENAKIFRLGIAPLLRQAGKYGQLARAIRGREEKRARKLMNDLFAVSGRAFYRLLGVAEKNPKGGQNGGRR